MVSSSLSHEKDTRADLITGLSSQLQSPLCFPVITGTQEDVSLRQLEYSLQPALSPKPSFASLKDEDQRLQRDGSRSCGVYQKGYRLMRSWNDFAASASFSFIEISQESKHLRPRCMFSWAIFHLESNSSSAAQSRVYFRPISVSPAPCFLYPLKGFIWSSAFLHAQFPRWPLP